MEQAKDLFYKSMEQALSQSTAAAINCVIVLGNSSCDLDSAVCPVVYALYLHWKNVEEKQCCDTAYIPVLNVDREDFEMKTEVAYFYKEIGLSKESLHFRNDEYVLNLFKSDRIKVVLVDHHILAQEDLMLQSKVTEIIDHRTKDLKNWKYGDEVKLDIQLVGSCATLIANVIRKSGNGEQYFETFPQCAKLLYGTIILDTVNFSKEINKGTPLDLEQVEYLEKILNIDNAVQMREEVLNKLVVARSDVNNLTSDQLLRKDVKICHDILVPSFPILVEEVLTRPDITAALERQMSRTNCTSVVMLGVHLSTPPARDLAVYSRQKDRSSRIIRALNTWENPRLDLQEPAINVAGCSYMKQGNLAASRKQIMPALFAFMDED